MSGTIELAHIVMPESPSLLWTECLPKQSPRSQYDLPHNAFHFFDVTPIQGAHTPCGCVPFLPSKTAIQFNCSAPIQRNTSQHTIHTTRQWPAFHVRHKCALSLFAAPLIIPIGYISRIFGTHDRFQPSREAQNNSSAVCFSENLPSKMFSVLFYHKTFLLLCNSPPRRSPPTMEHIIQIQSLNL